MKKLMVVGLMFALVGCSNNNRTISCKGEKEKLVEFGGTVTVETTLKMDKEGNALEMKVAYFYEGFSDETEYDSFSVLLDEFVRVTGNEKMIGAIQKDRPNKTATASFTMDYKKVDEADIEEAEFPKNEEEMRALAAENNYICNK